MNRGRLIDCSDSECFRGFPQPFQVNSVALLRLDHDRFLFSPLQFVIPYSSYFNNVFKIFEHGVLFKSLAKMPECVFRSQSERPLSWARWIRSATTYLFVWDQVLRLNFCMHITPDPCVLLAPATSIFLDLIRRNIWWRMQWWWYVIIHYIIIIIVIIIIINFLVY